MTEEVLLSVVVSPAIEDAMVDWLLDREAVAGFTSSAISGHGSSVHSLDLAEQVRGHQRRMLFQTHLDRSVATQLVEELRRDFAGSGIHYWLVPVLAAGHLT